jgi:hypothetical protein
MNQFDELAKDVAQPLTRRGALRNFGVSLAAILLASMGLASGVQAKPMHKKFKCQCKNPPYWGCTTQDCFAACELFCLGL